MLPVEAWAIALAAGRIGSAAEIYHGAVEGIAMRSEAVPAGTTDRTLALAAVVGPPVWDLVVAVSAAEAGADGDRVSRA